MSPRSGLACAGCRPSMLPSTLTNPSRPRKVIQGCCGCPDPILQVEEKGSRFSDLAHFARKPQHWLDPSVGIMFMEIYTTLVNEFQPQALPNGPQLTCAACPLNGWPAIVGITGAFQTPIVGRRLCLVAFLWRVHAANPQAEIRDGSRLIYPLSGIEGALCTKVCQEKHAHP